MSEYVESVHPIDTQKHATQLEKTRTRVAEQVRRNLGSGEGHTVVKAGLLGIRPTKHESGVYAAVAAELDKEGITIVARRDQARGHFLCALTDINTIEITHANGQDMPPQEPLSIFSEQLYP